MDIQKDTTQKSVKISAKVKKNLIYWFPLVN